MIKLTKYILILLSLIAFSCKSKSNIEPSPSEDAYVLAFKSCFLYGCINEATSSEFRTFLNAKNDLGLALESQTIGHYEVEEITNIGASYAAKIKTIDYADYEGRKFIYRTCVEYALSKEIEHFARQKYTSKKKLTKLMPN